MDDGCRGDLEFETTPRLVRIAAERHGGAVAIEDGPIHIRYEELPGWVGRVAAALMAHGVQPGDRVAIWAPNVWEWVVAALGIQAAGAVLVPINTRFKGHEAAYILRKSGVRVLFTITGFLDTDYVARLDALDDPPPLDLTVVLRGRVSGSAVGWDGFLETGAGVPAADVAARADGVAGDGPSDILFTSGTTGHPKGAVCTHAQSLRAYRDWGDVVGLRAGDRYLVVAPFFHCFGYKAGWLACLMTGATVLPHLVFDAAAVMGRVSEDRVTMLPGPPALYQSILAHPDRSTFDLSSLRLAVTGAASIPVVLIERMRDELRFDTVVTGYGLTEACGIATMCREDDDPVTIASTSGRAIPGVDVRVVNDSGLDVARGEAGEVVVRGYNVMRGYLDEPEQTAAALQDGWLHTGDIGVMDERGYLRITDRLKDMFIVGGFNAYPAEIEGELLRHPGVADVAVIGVPDPRLGEVGMAFVVPMAGATLQAEALHAWCRERMANYKVPRRFEVVGALPRNATGKVTKFVLRQRVGQGA